MNKKAKVNPNWKVCFTVVNMKTMHAIDHFHKWRFYFRYLLSVFKFAWLASFGLKYFFEFFTQRRNQPGKRKLE